MENDFLKQQQSAVEQMREMNSRSAFKSQKQQNKSHNNNNILSSLNIPFLDSLSTDGDMALILGLLLILMSENSDKTLLFALIYILL